MQDDPTSSDDMQWALKFPNQPDVTIAFMTNIGGSGLPGVGFTHKGLKQPVGYAMNVQDMADLVNILFAMIDKANRVLDEGEFENLYEALRAKKVPENVISLFGRKKP
jgi:hypothetical protein